VVLRRVPNERDLVERTEFRELEAADQAGVPVARPAAEA
jgi:hypothetical protein